MTTQMCDQEIPVMRADGSTGMAACGFPLGHEGSHTLTHRARVSSHGAITVELLEQAPRPETLEEWIGQAVGAATTIPYGPGVDEPFDSESASAIVDWAVAGIRRLAISGGLELDKTTRMIP